MLPINDLHHNIKKHIHTEITSKALQQFSPNTILDTCPLPIDPSGSTLDREDRVHLARLRCGHHPDLLSYKRRLDWNVEILTIHEFSDTKRAS
jgi:hypothetical protein